MKKMIFIIIAMVVCMQCNAQRKYCLFTNDPSYSAFPCNKETHEIDSKYIDRAKDLIDEYNGKVSNKIKYDSLVFDYPFKINIHYQEYIVGYIWRVSACAEGTYLHYSWADGMGVGSMRIEAVAYRRGKMSVNKNDILHVGLLLEPLGQHTENPVLYFCHTFVDDNWFNGSAHYSKKDMDEFLGTYQYESKSLR
ncbi:MAG: hypothetical protein MJZ61_06010 [Bacteroidales bacterium]|nr:hypothetical protein [Bacteroidales bacterium]